MVGIALLRAPLECNLAVPLLRTRRRVQGRPSEQRFGAVQSKMGQEGLACHTLWLPLHDLT